MRCGAGSGDLLRVEGERALCLACADLDHLEYVPRGAAALTRRARHNSVLQAVVVEWSRTRKRYERQGVLVEPVALRQAEEECLADAELRARRREQATAQRERVDQAYTAAFSASRCGTASITLCAGGLNPRRTADLSQRTLD